MRNAGFDIKASVEINPYAAKTYKMNNPTTEVFQCDIKTLSPEKLKEFMGNERLHLLAGCPPCQGFSSIRRLNGSNVKDKRNSLILDFLSFIDFMRPLTVMMENVPGMTKYYLFPKFLRELKQFGYHISYEVVNMKDYGIPQKRKRLVLVASLLGDIDIQKPTGERNTVRDAIGNLEPVNVTADPLHKITVKHTDRIANMIALIPHDGGSRKDLPPDYTLKCHLKENVGFCDVYGRLRWDDYSVTITGGCLNPSKGRFLHPTENRVITPREASLLQSFPADYIFPTDIPKSELADVIGEALPPKFSLIQSLGIKQHLDKYHGGRI
jgi:DNA (cytosine-5)-methyltransferase 1